MKKRFKRYFLALLGFCLGCAIVFAVTSLVRFPGYDLTLRYTTVTEVLIVSYALVGFAFGLLTYIFSPMIMSWLKRKRHAFSAAVRELSTFGIFCACAGLTAGLLAAYLLGHLASKLFPDRLAAVITLILYVFCGWLGMRLGASRAPAFRAGKKPEEYDKGGSCKVLDTSAIIDGRILDICRTGFIEGTLIVPAFVLKELRHIADSSDALKRGRGRRGLDIVRELQELTYPTLVVDEKDYPEYDEVDIKLLHLASDLDAALITNDYNLNKVASVQNMQVLNINDLANAIRPVLLPGEEVSCQIVKEGKEAGQGVAYMPDGTMIIVEGGRVHMGETLDIVVTGTLQTSAGRMVFARLA